MHKWETAFALSHMGREKLLEFLFKEKKKLIYSQLVAKNLFVSVIKQKIH